MTSLILFALLTAQDLDVQKLVEELYPTNERMKTMRVADLVHELHIQTGSIVADVGCGAGAFTIVLSRVVGSTGRVLCEDIDEPRDVRKSIRKYSIKNVQLVKGSDDDPKLAPASVDAVLMVIAYHEMPKWQPMLQHVREALKPGGRLVICDNTPHRTANRPRESQTKNHTIAESIVASDLEASGFQILHRDSSFIDNPDSENQQWLIVATQKNQ